MNSKSPLTTHIIIELSKDKKYFGSSKGERMHHIQGIIKL
jgi:hypothetical protein